MGASMSYGHNSVYWKISFIRNKQDFMRNIEGICICKTILNEFNISNSAQPDSL